MPRELTLKIKPVYFNKVANGTKTAELRFDDRNYKVGDILVLKEYDVESIGFTGRQIRVQITDILSDFEGLKPDYVMLSFQLLKKKKEEQ